MHFWKDNCILKLSFKTFDCVLWLWVCFCDRLSNFSITTSLCFCSFFIINSILFLLYWIFFRFTFSDVLLFFASKALEDGLFLLVSFNFFHSLWSEWWYIWRTQVTGYDFGLLVKSVFAHFFKWRLKLRKSFFCQNYHFYDLNFTNLYFNTVEDDEVYRLNHF